MLEIIKKGIQLWLKEAERYNIDSIVCFHGCSKGG